MMPLVGSSSSVRGGRVAMLGEIRLIGVHMAHDRKTLAAIGGTATIEPGTI